MKIPSTVKSDPRWAKICPKHRTNLGKVAQRFSLGEIIESRYSRFMILSAEWDLDNRFGALVLNILVLEYYTHRPFYAFDESGKGHYDKLRIMGNYTLELLNGYKTIATL